MESYTIKQFINGEHKKKPWYKRITFHKKEIVKLTFGVTVFLFSIHAPVTPVFIHPLVNTFALFFDNPVDTMSITKKVTQAFEPLIILISSLAYPIASLLVVYGSILFMLGRSDKGTDVMFKAALGYVLLKISPQLLEILIDIIDTIDLSS